MHKIIAFYVGALSVETVYSINEINSDQEYVKLPTHKDEEWRGMVITRIGFEQEKDTRSEYERWKDEYYHSYYPNLTGVGVEVKVSPNIKKIFIPHTITQISGVAFKDIKDMQFEIDENNKYYKVEDNKIIEISSGRVIWPYNEK